MRPHGSPEELERRRFRVATLIKDGFSSVEIADRLGVDRRSVRRWKADFRRHGSAGLKAVPASGRPLRMGLALRRRLSRHLLAGARKAGYPTDLWTCPRVAKFIHKRFGIAYHARYVPRMLRSMGWSPQRPERMARERDERAIQRWVKVEWPRIKKKSK